MATVTTAHHEGAKGHEGHEESFVQERLRGLRATSRLREKPCYLTVAAALAVVSCGRTPAATPPPPNTAAAAAATGAPPTGSAVPHGDHNPHHGGVVMMKGDDLHYEVVLDPSGRSYRVYFTDAVREELPASIAADVVLTLRRPSGADERITMQVDDAGESWVGRGRTVDDPSYTTARLAFAIRHEPYWIDLPFSSRK